MGWLSDFELGAAGLFDVGVNVATAGVVKPTTAANLYANQSAAGVPSNSVAVANALASGGDAHAIALAGALNAQQNGALGAAALATVDQLGDKLGDGLKLGSGVLAVAAVVAVGVLVFIYAPRVAR